MKLLGRNIKIPKRPAPKYPKRPKYRRKVMSPTHYKQRPLIKKQEYDTYSHVHMYKHHKIKTFKGKASRQEARLLVTKLKEKDPLSKYVIKTERVQKKGIF